MCPRWPYHGWVTAFSIIPAPIFYHKGKLRGEMIVHQHTDAPPGLNLVFQRREVTCGFTGTYSDGSADVDGTALVGTNSISFRARLMLKSRNTDI